MKSRVVRKVESSPRALVHSRHVLVISTICLLAALGVALSIGVDAEKPQKNDVARQNAQAYKESLPAPPSQTASATRNPTANQSFTTTDAPMAPSIHQLHQMVITVPPGE